MINLFLSGGVFIYGLLLFWWLGRKPPGNPAWIQNQLFCPNRHYSRLPLLQNEDYFQPV